MELAEAGVFFTVPEAQLGRALLEAAGIRAMVARDDAGGMYAGGDFGRVRLLVRPEDLSAARRILAED